LAVSPSLSSSYAIPTVHRYSSHINRLPSLLASTPPQISPLNICSVIEGAKRCYISFLYRTEEKEQELTSVPCPSKTRLLATSVPLLCLSVDLLIVRANLSLPLPGTREDDAVL
jgi:hypothetical protein